MFLEESRRYCMHPDVAPVSIMAYLFIAIESTGSSALSAILCTIHLIKCRNYLLHLAGYTELRVHAFS